MVYDAVQLKKCKFALLSAYNDSKRDEKATKTTKN